MIFKIICFFGVFLLINHNVHGILCWSAEAWGPGQRHWGDQAFQGFKGSKAPRCAQRCPSSDPQKAIYIKGNERLLCLFVFSICFYLLSSFMFFFLLDCNWIWSTDGFWCILFYCDYFFHFTIVFMTCLDYIKNGYLLRNIFENVPKSLH